MQWLVPTSILALLAGCSLPLAVPSDLAGRMAAAPADAPCRLTLDGDRVVSATMQISKSALPQLVRTTIQAVAPEGETTFRGLEWGPHGAAYRIEKRYALATGEHARSALIAEDGRVLERSHSVPLHEVPQPVLATATEIGSRVERADIVSGEKHEERWRCTVADGAKRRFVVTTGLDGTHISVTRLVTAQLGLKDQGMGIGRKSIASTEAR